MSNTSVASRMADWVAGAKFQDLPRRVVEEAKNQIFSVIAAVHAGHFSDIGRAASRTVRDWSAGKEATLIPSGERTTVHYAIFGNAALSMALSYDDYLFGGHTGHSAVLVTLALAEKLGIGGQDFILAQVLANEVEARVGISTGSGVLSDYMTPSNHLIGAAVVAAKLLKLDRQQIESAIAISVSQPSLGMRAGFLGTDAKVLVAAMCAPVGVQAAELAANGFRGATDVFEGEQGFLQHLGRQQVEGAFASFGEVWLSEALSYKMYPGCTYIQSIIDCILDLSRQHHIDGRKVRAVHVLAGPGTVQLDAMSARFVEGPESLPTTLNFCVAYNVAVALIDKELSPRQFTRDRIKDTAVWELAKKVHLAVDEDLARRIEERSPLRAGGDPASRRSFVDLEKLDLSGVKLAYGAKVCIETEGGRRFEKERDFPPGSGLGAFDDRRKVVEDKFRRETRYTLRKERLERAIDSVHHLEESSGPHIRELVRLCCSERT